MSLDKRVEGDELRREIKQLKLKLSKGQNTIEDLRQELEGVTARYERALREKESTHEREKKLLQKLIKDANKEMKALKTNAISPIKQPNS